MGILSWLVVLSILFLCFWKSQRPKGFPPGPWSPPLTGILFYLSRKEPLKALDQLAQKYGPVFSLYLGGKRAVFTHGFSSAKEVLVTKGLEFAGRPDNLLVDYMIKKKGIITAPYGQAWKEQRRFSLMLLRNFGLGKKSMEEKILQEATCLIEAFAENSGAPFDPQPFVETAVTNIISSILFGKRFENNDSSLRTVLNILHQNLKLIVGPWAMLYNAVPLVRRLPLPHQRILTNVQKIFAFLEKEVEEHKTTFISGETRDFVDAYLEEIKKAEQKGSSFEEEQLRVLLMDLLSAGSETTARTIQWALLYLVAFSEIQEKCQKEIDFFLGSNSNLQYEDREKLPYTNAVIHEIQRHTTVVPLGAPHTPIQNTQLCGYQIPKGTIILINLHSVHHDESQWKFPHEFNPSNFLNEEGDFVKPEAFLAFSAGPRVCLGENLARMELFLFLTSILRNFQLSWPDKSRAPDLTPNLGLTQFPSSFKILMKSRQESN
ncbi:cytochrome P450 2J6-like [Pseudonaja textilis]|uniref:cytochrome P450 2J6-like n=1 Tax=Pseudonaja textilis TaxID=8673 RepID=UPI000EAA099B|nr:cytochrome P450 2J6-like [Pseudonaja textilis]XP_026570163.1 cytochrome P450 2J6-like [Pseudonaja textilis]XP_026570164.1 cytochrome P450 2J6-like [Pseudonaja textilis]XP_026570165.1 cytochrome P450 2J6-like [Pseudonaja textilis]